ncbi:beta-ketoacyl-[acyl-carrier-protein] synthase family protein [Amycolatopsis sp. CA-230715]|uniref:beta-ketoacyl-[acyl-carrier-protein] synthase family protein n=1 Tax=Amycolatopsis sp. CA-230715 TaxID=2745196 RepID=UPI001C01CACA|nr:beta-ketoacyl-[acyl-carrier-protein] synthase family protein [Amycolatopsis sp. CA-230715]QWF84495.1 3-oxoacyl-[acyl-carrier-protein] synthase 2 [Amycolatopsis sp. CA-230715]
MLTGLGVLSSIGVGAAEFADGLRAGRSGAKPIEGFDTEGFEYTNACEVRGFDPHRWVRELPVHELGRASQFSVAATGMAIENSGLPVEVLRARRGLIALGTTDGEGFDLDRLVQEEIGAGLPGLDTAVVRRLAPHRLPLVVAREFGLSRVETATITTACAAGNYAIGYGFDAVRNGEVDYALCGGADAICRKTFAGFYRMGTIAPDLCRPFDKDRKGILTGEGAGVVLMESLESALARGARVHAEVLGYGLGCDAFHQVAPQQDGVARCMSAALDNAGVKPEQVDFISAHGTGTKANDVTESRAIRQVFGTEPPRTVSMKSMLGHTMGAASALALIGCALAITHGFVPPTINHRETDPECEIDCVPNVSVPADVRIAQNNGLAFGGNNAVVLLGKYEEGAR